MSWRVDNADATRARLASAGIDVSDVRTGRKPGTRVLTVRSGTCGIPTLLVERTARAVAAWPGCPHPSGRNRWLGFVNRASRFHATCCDVIRQASYASD